MRPKANSIKGDNANLIELLASLVDDEHYKL